MNKPLILVVEDDAPVRSLIATTLKTHDYKYLSAQNGAGAITEAPSHNPDVVLLDLGLPDMDGVDVIRKIRSWSNMPIIVISARTEDSDKIEALDAGADDYLTKPFSVEELLARLRVTQRRLALMKTDFAQESPVFMNGALKIDYAAGCAFVHGYAAQKAGTRREKAAVCSNAYRHRLSHAEGGLSGQIAKKERKRNTTQAMSAERKSSLGSRNME